MIDDNPQEGPESTRRISKALLKNATGDKAKTYDSEPPAVSADRAALTTEPPDPAAWPGIHHPRRSTPMPSNAIDELKAQQQTTIEKLKSEREHAPAQYGALLDPAREPQPGDVVELRRLMAVLRLSEADVEEHAKARREVANLDDLTAEIEKVDAECREVTAELARERELFREAEKRHITRGGELGRKSRILAQTADGMRDRQDRVHDLRRKHPFAFGLDIAVDKKPAVKQYIHQR